VLLTLVVAALLVGVVGRGWWRGTGGSDAPATPLAGTRVEPATALFGDVLTARVSLLLDPDRVDPRTLRVDASFRPYRVIAARRQAHDGGGRAERVDYTFRLSCLTMACLGAMERELRGGRVRVTPIRFTPAHVVARTTDGRPVDLRVRWSRVVVRSRLTPAEIAAGEVRRPPVRPPPVTYSISPHVLGGLLLGLAALLILTGVYLVATGLVSDARLAGRLRRRRQLTPLERALALVRDAAENGDAEAGRKALERLAAELRRSGDVDRAAAAGRIAWSEERPSRESVRSLIAGLTGSVDGT
jgi:hypothetical protein